MGTEAPTPDPASGATHLGGGTPVAADKSSIRDKVIDIVCEQMGASREKVTDETSFINDLGADSLDTVELVMEFEDEFDLNIPDEDAEKIQTVGDAIRYIESHT
jgi:acyl carrier protein